MNYLKNQIRLPAAIAGLLVSILMASLQPAASAQNLTISTVTPTPAEKAENPFLKLMRPHKPMPLKWKIAIVLGVLVIGSGSLWISTRVWQSANLFDREYRLPLVTTAALRLGATRSGGHMATITFRNRAGPAK